MRKIRIGQIGLGHNHGSAKMAAVRKFPELFEVIGYAEEDEKWVEKRSTLPMYQGLLRMSVNELVEKCDAILVECDVWNLTRYAAYCVERGKHVHIDKPASGSLSEWKDFLDFAEEKGRVVQMGYMYRYNPAVLECLRHIENGDLGEIYSINAEMSTYHNTEYKKWLSHFSGGVMYIMGSHLVDLAVYLLGEPKRVTSFLKHTGLDGVDYDDNCLAVLEYDRALVRIFVSSVEMNGWGRRQLVVAGSKATVNIMPLENPCKMTYADRSVTKNDYHDEKLDVVIDDNTADGRYDLMVKDFYAYIMGEKENPFTYGHEYKVQKVLDEIVGGVRYE